MFDVHPLPLETLVSKLNDFDPFTLVRIGDGEMFCVMGMQGANCDGVKYNLPDLRESLSATLIHYQQYYYCIAPKVMSRKNGTTERSVAWIEKHAPFIKWYDSETILNASVTGELKPFTQALRKRKIMIVGPAHLRSFPLPLKVFIEIPKVNAWLLYEDILRAVRRELYQVDTVLLCCGFVAKCLAWELHAMTKDSITVIDIGSTFDYVVGIDSRSYSRNLTKEQKIRLSVLNFGISESMAQKLLGF